MKLTKRLTIGLMIIFALFGALMLGMTKVQPSNAAEETNIISKGDINRDGKVDMKDVILASQYLAEVVPLDATQIEIGDVTDGDNKITLNDLVKICQRIVGDDVVFDSCKHNNVDSVVTAPTCTEGGYTTYTCLSCGFVRVGDETEATGHAPAEAVKENIVEAKCLTTGSYESVVYCSVCSTELSRQSVTVPSKGHTAAEAVEANREEATCAKAGSYDLVTNCAVCSVELSRETKTIAKTNQHTEVIDDAVDPTCTTTGLSEGKHCKECGAVLVEQKVKEKIAHTKEPIPAVEEGCTTSGWTAGEKCSVCQTILTAQKLIPATGHDIEETRTNEVPATCTQAGSDKVSTTCTKCDTVFDEVTVPVPMLAHDYQGNEEVDAEHDFCKDVKQTCSTCNKAIRYELSGNSDRTRHNMTSTIVDASDKDECSDVKFTCSGCNYSYYQRSNGQARTKHDWPTTGQELTAATCLTDGVELYVCKKCSTTKNGTLSATGHHYTVETTTTVAATDAYCADTKYDCKNCDYVYYDGHKDGQDETVLTLHEWDTGTVKTAVSCTTNGEMTYTCTHEKCGYTKEEPIIATGHDYVDGKCTKCPEKMPFYIDPEILGELAYTLQEDGTYAVTGIGTWTLSNYIQIPSTYNGKAVTAINGFSQNTAITMVDISDSVRSIGNGAFYACTNLTSVKLGKNVTSIGNYAFYECGNLKDVNLPDSLTSVGISAFGSCYYCDHWIIPSSLKTIGSGAFGGYLYFKGTEEQWNAVTGKENATAYYYSKTEPTITHTYWRYNEKGVPTVWVVGSENLSYVYKEDGTCEVVGIGTCSVGIKDKDWSGGNITLVIPKIHNGKPVTSIGKQAFYNLERCITEIIVPDSVISIGDEAFKGISSYRFGIIMPTSVTSVGKEAITTSDIYYEGTEEQWYAISGDTYTSGYDSLHIYSETKLTHNYDYSRYWYYDEYGDITYW